MDGLFAVPRSDSVATTDAEATTIPVAVSVAVADQATVGTSKAGPVSLSLTTGQAAHVLAVPVTALVAFSGGGFGVQVVCPRTRWSTSREDGIPPRVMVEITSDGIQ